MHACKKKYLIPHTRELFQYPKHLMIWHCTPGGEIAVIQHHPLIVVRA